MHHGGLGNAENPWLTTGSLWRYRCDLNPRRKREIGRRSSFALIRGALLICEHQPHHNDPPWIVVNFVVKPRQCAGRAAGCGDEWRAADSCELRPSGLSRNALTPSPHPSPHHRFSQPRVAPEPCNPRWPVEDLSQNLFLTTRTSSTSSMVGTPSRSPRATSLARWRTPCAASLMSAWMMP